ncbi:MAG: hypothetical protein RL303_797 [Verrucomicrobiota bacterium]
MLRLFAILCLIGLINPASQAYGQTKPLVISSFTIIEDWIHVIAPEGFAVENIVPSHSETHGFQISPRHARELRRASLIVGMSPTLEPWLAAWAKANQRTEAILWLYPGHPETTTHDHGADPHAWTNPAEVKAMTGLLARRLGVIAPHLNTEKTHYQYVKELERVDAELRSLFSSLPADRRVLITQHANLGHFAETYGLRIPRTILASSSAESADPSARHFSELLRVIRQEGVRVIVTDAGQNDAFARRLTEDAGLPPPLALSFEYLEPPGRPGDTWVSMMLHNGRRLHDALAR